MRWTLPVDQDVLVKHHEISDANLKISRKAISRSWSDARMLSRRLLSSLMDPNANVAMGESDDIIEHLFATHGGDTKVPLISIDDDTF